MGNAFSSHKECEQSCLLTFFFKVLPSFHVRASSSGWRLPHCSSPNSLFEGRGSYDPSPCPNFYPIRPFYLCFYVCSFASAILHFCRVYIWINSVSILTILRIFKESCFDPPSLCMLPFWLLVASLAWSAAIPLMQCPYYQYTGAHFADNGRMASWVNPLVLVQWTTGLKLITQGSLDTTLTAKPTPGLAVLINFSFSIKAWTACIIYSSGIAATQLFVLVFWLPREKFIFCLNLWNWTHCAFLCFSSQMPAFQPVLQSPHLTSRQSPSAGLCRKTKTTRSSVLCLCSLLQTKLKTTPQRTRNSQSQDFHLAQTTLCPSLPCVMAQKAFLPPFMCKQVIIKPTQGIDIDN